MTGEVSTHLFETPYLDSEHLASLRQLLEIYPALQNLAGRLAQYTLVIDANIAVQDLIHKYRHPHIRQTAIEETVKSSAIRLCAPTWLDREMVGSTIPQVSKKRGIPEATLLEMWAAYKAQIIWDDRYAEPVDGPINGDAKDVPYVALQETLCAAAILSRDKDIDQLGGNKVGLEFVLSVRSYARAATVVVGIRVGGTLVSSLSFGLLIELVKGLGRLVANMPDWVKFALLSLTVFVAVHPPARERVLGFLTTLGGELTALWPEVEKLIALATVKDQEAVQALGEAEQMLIAEQ
jgi:predicted nucleic acid-binding protein